MLKRADSLLALLFLLLLFSPALLAQQPATFVQPRIPEDVRRFESYYRAGVWRMPAKEVADLEVRTRTALGLPEATPGARAAESAGWHPAQFRAELQRESQHFASKLLQLSIRRGNLVKEVKDWYLSEERTCAGDKPEKCIEEAKKKACVRLEDGYQRLHSDWRNLLFDFYQTKLEILTENDQKFAAMNPALDSRELAREWMQKSYQETAARFVSGWGATLERQWGDYCTLPAPADSTASGWESALRNPFPALK